MLSNIAEERGPQLRYERTVTCHIAGFEKLTQEYGLFKLTNAFSLWSYLHNTKITLGKNR